MSAQADFMALCAQHGVDPDSIPDRRRRQPLPSRRYQRSPNRARSYERRHRLATMLAIPATVAAGLTIADRAVLKVVADEVVACGACELTNDEIAARAGVCRKSVTRALMYAAGEDVPQEQRDRGGALRLISIERRRGRNGKNLPNVVRIVSKLWLSWLRIGPKRQARTVGQFGLTTENRSFQNKRGGASIQAPPLDDELCRQIRRRLLGRGGS